MDEVVIKSANTSATFSFYDREGDYFSVAFYSPAIKIDKRVWGYADCDLLVDLFMFIAQEWRGWKGIKEWSSIEGEFAISAACDSLGHVTLVLSMKEVDGPEVWSSSVSLGLDSGQTEKIAKDVRKFFAG